MLTIDFSEQIIQALVAQDKKSCLSCLSSLETHAIALHELAHLRDLKRVAVPSVRANKTTHTLWDTFIQQLIAWPLAKTAKKPQHLLPGLVSVLNEFFKDNASFHQELLVWLGYLNTCSPDDVMYLYRKKIGVDARKKPIYFIDFLTDAARLEPRLSRDLILKMAAWLFKHDVSLVCSRKEFRSVYQETLCPQHTLNKSQARLQDLLLHLDSHGSSALATRIQALLGFLHGVTSLETIVLDSIVDLFKTRWSLVQDTSLDYRVQVSGINQAWINFAKVLSSSGILYTNYFCLLMPNLTALSLKALSDIRRENRSLYYTIAQDRFENFCAYLGESIHGFAPTQADLPRTVLYDLRDVLEEIYALLKAPRLRTTNAARVIQSINIWANQLQACAMDDVNLLYKQSISWPGHEASFADVMLDLLALLQQDLTSALPFIMARLSGLAQFLVTYDHALIIHDESLEPLYQAQNLGQFFKAADLQRMIQDYCADHDDDFLCALLMTLSQKLTTKTHIDDEIFQSLRVIYQTRAQSLLQPALENFSLSLLEKDHFWHSLAQRLAGLGFFPGAYSVCSFEESLEDRPWCIAIKPMESALKYRVLGHDEGELSEEQLGIKLYASMSRDECRALLPRILQITAAIGVTHPLNYYYLQLPSLHQYAHDPIHLSPVTSLSLSHAVLNDDLTTLLPLQDCLEQWKADGAFSYCEHLLTRSELLRARLAHGRYLPAINNALDPLVDQPLHSNTVFMLRSLIENTLFVEGLNDTYSVSQGVHLCQAYKQFSLDYAALSAVERERLYTQRIFLSGKNFSFGQTWEDVHAPEYKDALCVTLANQRIAKLVMDYMPTLSFHPQIEEKCLVTVRKNTSMNKIFSDQSVLAKKLKMICVSLMTRPLNGFLESIMLYTLWDCTQNVNRVVFNMANIMRDSVLADDEQQMALNYCHIVHQVVPEALKTEKTHTTFLMWYSQAPLAAWLESIQNGSLFQTTLWFERSILFQALSTWDDPPSSVRSSLVNFLDDLMQTSLQNTSEGLKDLRVNINFQRFLLSLSMIDREKVLNSLRYGVTLMPEDHIEYTPHNLYVTHHDEKTICVTGRGWRHNIETRTLNRYDDLHEPSCTLMTPSLIQAQASVLCEHLFHVESAALEDLFQQYILKRLSSLAPGTRMPSHHHAHPRFFGDAEPNLNLYERLKNWSTALRRDTSTMPELSPQKNAVLQFLDRLLTPIPLSSGVEEGRRPMLNRAMTI